VIKCNSTRNGIPAQEVFMVSASPTYRYAKRYDTALRAQTVTCEEGTTTVCGSRKGYGAGSKS